MRDGTWDVVCVDVPAPDFEGVVVLDSAALERLPSSAKNLARVVLITRKDAASLSKAWDAGVISVVFEDDPLDTAMLAIMSARLRFHKGGSSGAPTANRPVREGSPDKSQTPPLVSGPGRSR
jgi:DNA-binding NarL/FixJ family response regulator